MREGISVTSNPENAVNPGENSCQNLSLCEMLCSVQIFYAFYTLRVIREPTLNDFCGYNFKDIFTIDGFILCIIAIKAEHPPPPTGIGLITYEKGCFGLKIEVKLNC